MERIQRTATHRKHRYALHNFHLHLIIQTVGNLRHKIETYYIGLGKILKIADKRLLYHGQ